MLADIAMFHCCEGSYHRLFVLQTKEPMEKLLALAGEVHARATERAAAVEQAALQSVQAVQKSAAVPAADANGNAGTSAGMSANASGQLEDSFASEAAAADGTAADANGNAGAYAGLSADATGDVEASGATEVPAEEAPSEGAPANPPGTVGKGVRKGVFPLTRAHLQCCVNAQRTCGLLWHSDTCACMAMMNT